MPYPARGAIGPLRRALADDSTRRTMAYTQAEQVLEDDKKYRLRVETSHGTITAVLDPELGGPIPNSIAFLAKEGFYDGLTFHRVVPGFVLQGGCPNGNGAGNPGYEVIGTPPRYYEYKVGDFAMAKTGHAPAGASGSQFFVISGPSGERLPAEYGILGHARDEESLATIKAIDALGERDGPPSEPVTIVKMTLEEIGA
jgi:cyclophilin family peptidyl-prolyl cis-trans isomerase